MNVGRKIYYEIATGNVILDTGERKGSVVPTTKEHDFSVYPVLIGKNINDYDYLELNYGERGNEFINYGSLKVNPITKELTIYPRLFLTTDKTQIASDGIDTATITADHDCTFSINGEGEYSVNPLEFSSEVAGSYKIVAVSALYGSVVVEIEVI